MKVSYRIADRRATLRHAFVHFVLGATCALAVCGTVKAAVVQAPAATRGVAIDAQPAADGMLEMYRGEVRMLDVPGTIKRIAIGNGKLITANVVDGKLMLLGENAGMTSLVVWNGNGVALQTTVRIAKSDVTATAAQLRSVLAAVPGLRVQTVGPNIVLAGAVHRDMAPVVKAAIADMNNVIDTTTIDEGDALKKTVHFKVQIMEITRTGQRELGIAWDSQFNGPQLTGQGFAGSGVPGANFFFAGLAASLTSRINFAINKGDAYILAAPELNAKSGGTATFLAGGEVPIPKAGALGTTDVDYKPYGIKLNIKPVVDANNIISANVQTEISQIDPSVSYGGFPGFLTRSATSDISLRAGETIAISGLVSADALDASNGMPFLAQLPIIGQLFRSDNFRSKKSDLVIFVTPLISDPTLAPNTDLLARSDKGANLYRERFGNPSPLDDAASPAPAPAQAAPKVHSEGPAPVPATPGTQDVGQAPAPLTQIEPREARARVVAAVPTTLFEQNGPPAKGDAQFQIHSGTPVGLAEAILMRNALLPATGTQTPAESTASMLQPAVSANESH
ncbi:MAG TPA: pilus assembly protein N-terminal domain-containing protein [Candidatus Limnocylindria bacterium]|uniref:Pilus assembly protein N-terminal domain-containing protein n=1 Tax=Paraburkholderia edwinii TaxID=2861782 RepID=A0ABX8UTP2_9BURK|nr:pilus assembly protein N-terminal domain-containing protein [Paraburkholderia edwinii]QYD72396.1 pilus assembly protein N-terminal domain-containing protein [Paraburkholderia edwinii]HTJ26155.1 pilus assembly protein N-terminal domain-containing protein [Candidatus Limnocylindria bacterium]